MSLNNFTLMKQLLEQYFLLRSGKRGMTGALDLDGHKLLSNAFLLKDAVGIDGFYVRNPGDTDFASIGCKQFSATELGWYGVEIQVPLIRPAYEYANLTIRTGNQNAGVPPFLPPSVLFQSKLQAGGLVEVGKLYDGAWIISRAGDITMLTGKYITIGIFTDATRGAAGAAGRVIFNTDDANLNIDDGTNWILPDGTVT